MAKGRKRGSKVRRPTSQRRSQPPKVPMVLFIVSACLLFGSITIPWGGLDVETKLGIIPVTLKAGVYEYGVSYEADLSSAGGIIQVGNMSGTLKSDRVFLTGLGDFQETIGFVKGSAKYKNHTIELYTLPGDNNVKVLVETYAASIPWWPVGVPQEVSITIKIIEPPVNITHLEVQKVWFEIHREVDGKDLFKKVWGSSPNDKLKKLGDSKTYETKVTVDDHWGSFSIVGRAELEFIDINGDSNDGRELRSYAGNPKMIDLWTISQGTVIQIVLMVAAFPISLVAGILLVLSMSLAYMRKSWAWKMAAAGAIMAILSIIFFMLGINALIGLTGYIDWFEWNLTGLGLALTGSVMAFMATGLLFKVKPPKTTAKKKGSTRLTTKAKRKVRRRKASPTKGQIKNTTEEEAWMPSEEE